MLVIMRNTIDFTVAIEPADRRRNVIVAELPFAFTKSGAL